MNFMKLKDITNSSLFNDKLIMCKKSSLESYYVFQTGAPSVGNNFPLALEDEHKSKVELHITG